MSLKVIFEKDGEETTLIVYSLSEIENMIHQGYKVKEVEVV